MPAHIKSAILPVSLSIPVAEGRMALGTWQGIYLVEHRTHPHRRAVRPIWRLTRDRCGNRSMGFGPRAEPVRRLRTDLRLCRTRLARIPLRPLYVDRLRAEGFEVEEGSAGMPTAFSATWGQGDGPTVLMYAEYDAVPANCQAAATEQRPRDGLSPLAAGHTDPHSALGVGALGGLLATKAVMQAEGIAGTLRFTGEPAEKVRGSKPLHAAAGYYDGCDAILSFHPFYMLPLCNTVRWDTHCGACHAMIFRFICDEPETIGAKDGAPIPQAHTATRAPGATDALVQMYQTARTLRSSMLPHVQGWSISEAILNAGQATADNLPGAQADLQYLVRAPDLAMCNTVSDALMRVADSVAALTHCKVERHWVSKSRPGLANHALAQVAWDALQNVGPPQLSDASHDLARQIRHACGDDAQGDPFLEETKRLIAPQKAESILPPRSSACTGELHLRRLHRHVLARPDRPHLHRPSHARTRADGAAWPAWAMNALGGMRATIDPTVQTAARVLARTALRVLTDADARTAMRAEFDARTAQNPIPPLADYPPPIHFSWPEYVETARGHDWWIPSG